MEYETTWNEEELEELEELNEIFNLQEVKKWIMILSGAKKKKPNWKH